MDVGQVYSLGKIYAYIKGNYCICVSLLEILLIVPHQVRWEDQYTILVGVSSSHCDLFKLGPLKTGMKQLKVTALVLLLVYHLLAMGTQVWSITTCTRESTPGLPIPTPYLISFAM